MNHLDTAISVGRSLAQKRDPRISAIITERGARDRGFPSVRNTKNGTTGPNLSPSTQLVALLTHLKHCLSAAKPSSGLLGHGSGEMASYSGSKMEMENIQADIPTLDRLSHELRNNDRKEVRGKEKRKRGFEGPPSERVLGGSCLHFVP